MALPNEVPGHGFDKSLGLPPRQQEFQNRFFYCPFEPRLHVRSTYQGIHLDRVNDCSPFPLTSIRRLQEHICRYHLRVHHLCDRCVETFSSSNSLEQHRKENPECHLQPPRSTGPLTAQQQAVVLQERYRLNKTEHWNAIFRGLFPTTPLPASPYWDTRQANELFLDPHSETTSSGSETINLSETGEASMQPHMMPTATALKGSKNSSKPEVLARLDLDIVGISHSFLQAAELTKSAGLPSKTSADSGYGTQDSSSTLFHDDQHSQWEMLTSSTSTNPQTGSSLRSVQPKLSIAGGSSGSSGAQLPVRGLYNPGDLYSSKDIVLGVGVQHFLQMPPLVYRLLDVGSNERPHELRFEDFVDLDGKEFYIWTVESHQLGDLSNFADLVSHCHQRSKGTPMELLPLAFQDAIRMTRNLGCRYLWNEVLCTIQDDFALYPSQHQHLDLVYQKARARIMADPLLKICDYMKEDSDQPLRFPPQYDKRGIQSTEVETPIMSRWLQTPVRDDPWNPFSRSGLSRDQAADALPVYYIPPLEQLRLTAPSPNSLAHRGAFYDIQPGNSWSISDMADIGKLQISYPERDHQISLTAITAQDLHHGRLWATVNSMSLFTLIDSHRIMQLLQCLHIRVVCGASGTTSKPVRLVYPSTLRSSIGSRSAVPFLGLYNRTKNLSFWNQLQCFKLWFRGTTLPVRTNTITDQSTSQRTGTKSSRKSKARKADQNPKKSHCPPQRGSQNSCKIAVETPNVEGEVRLFRCIYSAAREQGIIGGGCTKKNRRCDKSEYPTVQRLKDRELKFYHSWPSEHRKLPKDASIRDYKEEDRWFRLFLKEFPCLFYNGVPLPNPYTELYSDQKSPHVSRYDPRSLRLEPKALDVLLQQMRSSADRGTLSIRQPGLAQTLSEIGPAGVQMLEDRCVDPRLIMNPCEPQDGIVSVSQLTPTTQTDNLHSPEAEGFANIAFTVEPPFCEIDFDPMEIDSNFHMPPSDQDTQFFLDFSTPPTSLRSITPLDSLEICFCTNTTDRNHAHYHCARQSRCGCANCGKWTLGSREGIDLLQRWAMEVGSRDKTVTWG